MWATILKLIQGLLDALNITLPKYFPPKATETKVEEGNAQIDNQISQEQSTGRPS